MSMDGNVADNYTGVNTIDNGENGDYICAILDVCLFGQELP